MDIEDLLFQTLDAVSRFRVGQREAIGGALEAGALLTEAKGRLRHGEWADWLGRVGLAPRTARTWMKLTSMGLTAEEVIERGGINAASQGRGKMAIIEGGDWGSAGDAKVSLKSERFGAEPPSGLVDLLNASSREIYSACGLNGALWGAGDAASTREAWRLALFSVLSPLGKLVESELRDKLDDDVSLTWTELRASDLSGRSRAFQSMVNGGMEVERAAGLAGLMVED